VAGLARGRVEREEALLEIARENHVVGVVEEIVVELVQEAMAKGIPLLEDYELTLRSSLLLLLGSLRQLLLLMRHW